MEAQGRTCAIEIVSGDSICLVNLVLNHHSASSLRGELSLALDREVIICSV
jgi:hypothetical protein